MSTQERSTQYPYLNIATEELVKWHKNEQQEIDRFAILCGTLAVVGAGSLVVRSYDHLVGNAALDSYKWASMLFAYHFLLKSATVGRLGINAQIELKRRGVELTPGRFTRALEWATKRLS
ncbi:MAG: hypothetical protein G01um10145_386 [Microgenomates group bacterium Gr01-1014_5]|nr:MAG: hypothetical protein G01um10145_386 [Microgenomates group bacterium Gr01-1014_5]